PPRPGAGGSAREWRSAMSAPEAGWRILHVDLGRPLPVVPRDGDAAGLQLVFWLDGLPLGRCEVAAGDLPLSGPTTGLLASRAVGTAVGGRLLARDFEAPMPAAGPEARPAGDMAPLLACRRPLAALRERLAGAGAAGASTADVSVVVCTRDRPEA